MKEILRDILDRMDSLKKNNWISRMREQIELEAIPNSCEILELMKDKNFQNKKSQ